jgi:two-component system, cell cycle sensor histidine kinase and response regulator CckA
MAMEIPGVGEFPPEEQVQQFRARIAKLEEEISRIRGGIAGPDGWVTGAAWESGLQYKEVFDNISVCMFLIDVTSDGRFKYAGFNAAEEKAIGLTSAEVSGKFVEEVFPEDLTRKLTANYRRCLEAGVPINYEDELDLPGGLRYFNSNLIPLRSGSGVIRRIVGACIDITDFKRTQEEALARQKLESLGVLGSILSQAELAEMELAEGSRPDQEIRLIKSVAIRAGEMVRELMVYSGQDPVSFDPVDLTALILEMLELLKISISKQAILKVDLPNDLPAVRANAAQIRQVVMNLITNASEALGDKEGVISVSLVKLESGAGARLGDCLQLEVSDSGSGMTESVVSKIFDPFFTTKFAGRGLGLAAVQGIIRSHGGTINVVSSLGQGTRFQILLPSISGTTMDSREISLPDSASGTDSVAGTALVVEDEEELRLAVSAMLRKERFTVLEASDGTGGTNLFLANEPKIDVVLLDLTLPGMSAKDVLEEMRRIRPDVKIVLTSAYSRDTVLSSIGKQQLLSYVRKPYGFGEVLSVLRMACVDKQRRSTAAS